MIESYTLQFKRQSDKAILVTLKGGEVPMWLPKSQIEICSDYDELVFNEILDIRMPDWLAEEKGLL